jgi:hypothetical protein
VQVTRLSGAELSESSDVQLEWDVKLALRDGTRLSAILYRPSAAREAVPAICTMTPYVAQNYHAQGMYFARQGYVFLAVDVRGRGNSEGVFHPLNEARDGYDVVEWLAEQPFCNGKVAMWGLSYLAYCQWATASQCPPHLITIVPAAAAYFGVDIPMRGNVFSAYMVRWLMAVSGRTLQDRIVSDQAFWNSKFQQAFAAGIPFAQLDAWVGNRSSLFQEWIEHPSRDEYWARYNPTSAQYAKLAIPILTITGTYDDDQPGALEHYRQHLHSATPAQRAQHYLIIGPWDHPGTQRPKEEFAGFKVGPASLLDLERLHVEWYAWTLRGGPRPEFLCKNVAYYVTGAEEWRYADTLDAITARHEVLYLQSSGNPVDVFSSGILGRVPQASVRPDSYTYDPNAVAHSRLEAQTDPDNLVDPRMMNAASGRQLVYHSSPLSEALEVSGFFRLSMWLAIDQADTDFLAAVYEVALDGTVLLLTKDWLRARYRSGPRDPRLIRTTTPLRYDFEHFTFVARRLSPGSRLRLVFGAIDSIHWERNRNSGGCVAHESLSDARPVHVQLYHDEEHPSALSVPIAAPN